MRLFVAITPDEPTRERIADAIDHLRTLAPSAKWVKGDGLHLTLAFLGEREPPDAPLIGDALAGVARGYSPLSLRIRGGGAFGRPGRPRVLWVGCEGDLDALRALHRDVTTALAPFGYVPDRPELTAHITLCRAREQGGDRALARCVEALRDQDFGAAKISAMELYESHLTPGGARHTVVARALFSGAD